MGVRSKRRCGWPGRVGDEGLVVGLSTGGLVCWRLGHEPGSVVAGAERGEVAEADGGEVDVAGDAGVDCGADEASGEVDGALARSRR